MTLITRTGKGSKLTIEEMDNNLLYLESRALNGSSGDDLWEIVPETLPSRIVTNGRLYNQYAVFDSRNIAPEGWHIPTKQEWVDLFNFTGNDVLVLKSTDTNYSNNVGTDEYGFNLLNSGYYYVDFGGIKENSSFWSSTQGSTPSYSLWALSIETNIGWADFLFNMSQDLFLGIRLIKDNNINEGDVTDIDGNIYNTVTIGNQVWMKQNLATTHYRNGDPIETNFTEYVNGIGGVMRYNNDESNVYGSGTEGKQQHLIPKNNKRIFAEDIDSVSSTVYIGDVEPTDPNIEIWIDTSVPVVLTDVELLKQLRDLNPLLADLFSDSKDPYTEWANEYGGVLFGSHPWLINSHQNGNLVGVSPETPLIPDRCYILELTYYQPLIGYDGIVSQLTYLTTQGSGGGGV